MNDEIRPANREELFTCTSDHHRRHPTHRRTVAKVRGDTSTGARFSRLYEPIIEITDREIELELQEGWDK